MLTILMTRGLVVVIVCPPRFASETHRSPIFPLKLALSRKQQPFKQEDTDCSTYIQCNAITPTGPIQVLLIPAPQGGSFPPRRPAVGPLLESHARLECPH